MTNKIILLTSNFSAYILFYTLSVESQPSFPLHNN